MSKGKLISYLGVYILVTTGVFYFSTEWKPPLFNDVSLKETCQLLDCVHLMSPIRAMFSKLKGKVKPFGAKLAHTAGTYPGFRSMKPTKGIATPPGWDASPSQVTTPQPNPSILSGCPNSSPVPIYTPGWREALWSVTFFPMNATLWLEPGPLDPVSNTLTIRPPYLPHWFAIVWPFALIFWRNVRARRQSGSSSTGHVLI